MKFGEPDYAQWRPRVLGVLTLQRWQLSKTTGVQEEPLCFLSMDLERLYPQESKHYRGSEAEKGLPPQNPSGCLLTVEDLTETLFCPEPLTGEQAQASGRA